MTILTDNSTTTWTEPQIFTTSPCFDFNCPSEPNRKERRKKLKRMKYCARHKILSKDHSCEIPTD